ncbi:MAG TPA: 2-C-methyl-D-erythritol 2,4-cyclodiphosphate synthase [bacterium]|nr:2-C-methyl-D-erythritol 2,4-cyclodiphosphate synthase [bacterium]HPN30449.1 2-C-methyl-D-erythritol 2,4-cyclodiphosphate synthase [bacterium]
MRVGLGIDVHKFEKGRDLIIGGEKIEHHSGLAGHSDADVLIHSIMDGLLGAAAAGDIGKHFPDNDNSYKNISSMILLDRVAAIIAEKKYSIINIDSVIIAQKPKFAPYIDKMRENIAAVLKIDVENISVKATTSEWLGFTGREEGIICYASVLIN